ncbi:MAG: hypothetical protein BWX49_00067 [Bacteroidetes bacterium ADurb.Bin008]|jgi:hypothetical protein|nr:MAG: hypothetical protein BWX49_00067 [Bacteroidetes bacterium ADurb.Bin008]
MQISLKIIVLLFGISFLLVFVSLVRRKNIKPFYSTLWLLVSLLMISLVVFEKFYKWVATLLGITDASFLVIVSLISFLLIYVLHLSIRISQMSDRMQELISHIGILDHQIRKLKEDESD